MADRDDVRVRIGGDTARLRTSMGEADRLVNRFARSGTTALRGLDDRVAALTGTFTRMQSVLVGLGAGLVLRRIITTSAEFQRLEGVLQTLSGSAEEADRAFDGLKRFAAETPFDLQQVVTAFGKLKARGLDPSIEALESYGNTAAAMGRSLDQFIEAVADAATGEFERLKEFGIVARSQGNEVRFTFQGVTTTVRKNAAEIERFLRGIGNVQFAGAMEEQAQRLGGALSNLGDAVDVFLNEIGEGGFSDAIADVARQMADAASGSDNLARQIGATLGNATRIAAAAARALAENLDLVASVLVAIGTAKAITGLVRLGEALVKVRLAVVALNAALLANPATAVAAAIGLLVGGLAILLTRSDQAAAAQQRHAEAMETARRISGDLATASGAYAAMLKTERDRILQTAEAEVTAIERRIAARREFIESLPVPGAMETIFGLFGQQSPDIQLAEAGDLAALEQARQALAALREQFAKADDAAGESAGGVRSAGDAADEAADKIQKLVDTLQFELDQLGRTEEQQRLYSLAKKAGVQVNERFIATVGPLVSAIAEEEARLKAAKEAAREHERALENLRSRGEAIFEQTRTAVERYQAEIAELNDLVGQGAIDWDTYGRAVDQAQKRLDDANEKTKDADSGARQLGFTFQSAFEDAIIEGRELSSVLQGLLQDIVRIGLRTTLTQPLGNFLASQFSGGNLLSSIGGFLLGGGGGAAAAVAPTAGAIVGGVGAAPYRLGGVFSGPVVPMARGSVLTSPIAFPMSGGRTGLAAEAGPEAIMPLARDSSGRLGVRGGGGPRQLVINVHGVQNPDEFTRTETMMGRRIFREWERGHRGR